MSGSDEFEINDVVKHKASGELGIIIEKDYRCRKESHAKFCPSVFAVIAGVDRKQMEKDNKCEMVFSGYYDISVGFDEIKEGISRHLIESHNAEARGGECMLS